MKYRIVLSIFLSGAIVLSGCGNGAGNTGNENLQETEKVQENSEQVSSEQLQESLDKINMARWQYNEDTDVYWQVGIVYCENPADTAYESLGIYVPGAYMSGTKNGDGTYTCEINDTGSVGDYTAKTAPIVIPVDTPGYSAMAAPTEYEENTSEYTDAGFVYVHAGCRGREAGAPAGVTDLKAAIRYIRYNGESVPGSTDRIFSFGMSGGGAQSALIGATGNSALYTPYLEAIGAVSDTSDAVAGTMCWCPITNLDYASEAYEWNLGVTRTDLEEDMQSLSDRMAEQFALYINELGLKDENGNTLTLTVSDEGIYQAGSYYDYLKTVIETSLNHFLEDTEFPYTVESGGRGGFGGPGGPGGEMGDLPDGAGEEMGRPRFGDKGDMEAEGEPGGRNGDFGGERPDGPNGDFDGEERPEAPNGDFEEGERPEALNEDFDGKGGQGMDGERPEPGEQGEQNDLYARDGINRAETSGGISLSGTYETVQDYIDALNEETAWVTYDSASNTATITSIADFVRACKNVSKDLGAFDALDETQGENILFGDGDGEGDHFDSVMAELLEGSDYETEFADDLLRTDALGTSVAERVNMYTPLYYLSDYYEGYGTSDVAADWRIRTGINQSDTALTTEVNLALALENYGANVDFETVWGQAHVEAERTGSSSGNFIAWVNECCR